MKLAQITNPILPKNPASGAQASSQFGELINVILAVLFAVGTLFFIFFFIIGAIRWITSSGDKNQVEAARSSIMNALIGLVVLFSLFAITKIIDLLFGTNITSIDLDAIRLK